MRRFLRASIRFIPHRLRSRIAGVPGIAALQRWLIDRFLRGTPFLHVITSGPAAGLRFEVTLPLDKAVWSGTYEEEFATELVQRVVKEAVCFDVGGYRGYFAGTMALAGAGRVIVFEPLPANQEAISRLCQLNPALPIELRKVALGKADGSFNFKVMPDPSMGKLDSSGFQPEASSASQIEVAVRSIDSIVAAGEAPAPALLKIDVEGAELDVLLGATKLLSSFRPIVMLEAHSPLLHAGCRELLTEHGYRVSRLEPVSHTEAVCHLVAVPI